MKIFSQKRGFTLVELLVVIAIIALLASIIIANINTGRNRAKNNVIKENLYSLKLAAELEYDRTTPQSYEGVCLESPPDISNVADTDFLRIRTAINGQGGTTRLCHDSAAKWCAEVTAMPYNSEDWCVDSTGYSGSTDNCGIGAGDNVYSCVESS